MNRPSLLAMLGLGASFLVAVPPNADADSTKPSYEERFPGQGISVNEDPTPTPLYKGNRLVRVWSDIDPGVIAPAANTNIIYMNPCDTAKGHNCSVVRAGSTDSTQNRSHIVGNSGTLPKLSVSDNTWNQVMMCLRDVFGPFNIDVRDTPPGNVPHFEIMFGGLAQTLGFDPNVGGVSPATCSTFIPNSLVFVFDVWGDNVEDICATAAQEIAHSWSLDHTTEASDPLTYFTSFNGRKRFKNGAENCGSDCVGGFAGNLQCSGANQQTRSCFCGGTTQNPTTEIKALFGDGTPTPPHVTILNPRTGDIVTPGFPVGSEVIDDQGVQKVEFRVNGQLISTLVTGPYAFNAPSDLADGTHVAEVTGYDVFGTTAKASVSVIIGKPCTKPSECPDETQTCVGGRCVPGPGVQGGLGTTCTNPQDCASGQCASSSDGSFCVEACNLDAGGCPSGFGCLDTGANDGTGVCFPGADEGAGGCSSGGGAIGLGLGFALLLFGRRRSRTSK